MLTSVSHAAKKTTKSKEQCNSERKQELEKRLLDVNGQLNPTKENFKCNVTLLFICNRNRLMCDYLLGLTVLHDVLTTS